jgi:alpha-L-fucosidase 2
MFDDMKLWYRQPAQEWVEALPVGNGRLGAMVFGGIQRERIQLNEDSV